MKEHETDMLHCWCNPKKRVFPNGSMLISHRYGDHLRETRIKKAISLREVERRLGLSAAFISDVENDKRNPNKKVLDFYKKLT